MTIFSKHMFTRPFLAGLIVTIGIVIILGRNLNPFANSFFPYHDITQPSRVYEYTNELRALHIPPQSAPDYAFGNGYPVFTFYAPTAYILTSVLNLVGFEVNQAIKLSFLIAIIVAFWGMYALCRLMISDTTQGLFSKWPNIYTPLVPAILYVSSPWVASEIFVRGNLAEMWLLALLPWGIWAILNERTPLLMGTVIVGLLFTSHNALSLVAIAVCAGIVVVSPHRRHALITYLTGLLMTVGFWVPFFAGISGTYAYEMSRGTEYFLHYLCLDQLWISSIGWGFGASLAGCQYDGMSFVIGKIHIVIGIASSLVFLITLLTQRKTYIGVYLLMIALCLSSVYMTLEVSSPIWDHLTPLQSFQFPWRFIVYVLFGLVVLTSYLMGLLSKILMKKSQHEWIIRNSLNSIQATHLTGGRRRGTPDRVELSVQRARVGDEADRPRHQGRNSRNELRELRILGNFSAWSVKHWIMVGLVISICSISLFMNAKYFYGQTISADEARHQYALPFIRNQALYKIREYIPRTVDLALLEKYEKTPPPPPDAALLRAQFSAYKPPIIVYTISHLTTASVLIFLIWLTISPKIRKKA